MYWYKDSCNLVFESGNQLGKDAARIWTKVYWNPKPVIFNYKVLRKCQSSLLLMTHSDCLGI